MYIQRKYSWVKWSHFGVASLFFFLLTTLLTSITAIKWIDLEIDPTSIASPAPWAYAAVTTYALAFYTWHLSLKGKSK